MISLCSLLFWAFSSLLAVVSCRSAIAQQQQDASATTPLDPFVHHHYASQQQQQHHHQCDLAAYTSNTQTIEIATDLTLTILQDSGQFLEGTESDATGTKIWDASLCLANYIHHHSDNIMELFDNNEDGDDAVIVELGSGVGLPSLTMAQKTQQSSPSSHSTDQRKKMIRMIATDREDATLQQLQAVTKLNGLEKYLTIQPLDWNDDNSSLMGQVDVILAADVVYHENMVHPLAGIMDRLLTKKKEVGRGIVYVALNNQRRGLQNFVEEAMPNVGFELLQTIPCAIQTGNTIYIFQRR